MITQNSNTTQSENQQKIKHLNGTGDIFISRETILIQALSAIGISRNPYRGAIMPQFVRIVRAV